MLLRQVYVTTMTALKPWGILQEPQDLQDLVHENSGSGNMWKKKRTMPEIENAVLPNKLVCLSSQRPAANQTVVWVAEHTVAI